MKYERTFKNRIKHGLIGWWIGTQPMFAVCLDCDGKRWPPTKGLVSMNFATLMSGRVKGRMFTGAGTCIRCYTDGKWINAFTEASDKLSKDFDSSRQDA